jgi:LPS sulfotransferase NodH
MAASDKIVVVSGLPRSGTSLMMKMLEAGGIPPLTDHERAADEDNPKGYFEFERAKQLKEGDAAWLPEAEGKVVKVITALLTHLPRGHQYDVIFMRRHMSEILASQKKMLVRRGEDPNKISDEELSALFEKHLAQVFDWLNVQTNLRYLEISYNDLLADPGPHVEKLNQFLGGSLDIEAMRAQIAPDLYRQRKETLQG